MNTERSAMNPELVEALGLARDPFDDRGVDGLFYPGAGRQECVDQLLHLLRFTAQVLLVSGLEGSGRTSVRDILVLRAERDVNLCSLDAELMRDPEGLLDEVLAGFGLQPGGGIEALARFCDQEAAARRLCWLLIDDAQQLSEQEVRLLSEVRERCGDALHVALFGPPTLEEVFHRRLPEGVELYRLALAPLTADDVKAYLDYRFRTAGFSGELPLGEAQWQQLAQQSRGSLLRLHGLAERLLAEAIERGPAPITALSRPHLVLVLIMLLAVGSLYLFNRGSQRDDQSAAPRVDGGRHRVEVLAPAADKASVPLPDVPSVAEPADQPAVASSGGEPLAVDQSEVAADDAGKADESQPASVPVPPAAVPEPDPEAADSEEAVPVRKETFVYGSTGRRGGETDPDEDYLLSLPASRWTVQLMGSHDAQAIAAFREQHGLDTRRYRKLRNARDWYVVVFGDYDSRELAKRAAASLPERLRRTQPWVRPLGDVQKEIREARGLR